MIDKSITLTKLGGIISTQDLGRPQSQHLGFGASGACDEYAYLSANEALGNHCSVPTLELFIFTEIIFAINADCHIFISGADSRATLNNKKISHWKVVALKKNDVLTLHRPLQGKITYIAISGGFNVEEWMGSTSQNVNEKSLCASKDIKIGDKILFEKRPNFTLKETPSSETSCSKNKPNYPWYNFYNFAPESTQRTAKSVEITLRFIPSSFFLALPFHEQNTLLQQAYDINPESNRMGYRLQSEKPIHLIEQKKLLSKPVTYGTIQLPPNGQPIVLMKDRQTIGGYPVLGVVMKIDLFRLSQCHAGDKVKFSFTSLTFAQTQLNAFYQKFYKAMYN